MDFQKGFPAEMGIVTEWGPVTQTLDYEGIPFKCHRCHAYGHVVANCSMVPRPIHIEEIDEEKEEAQEDTSQGSQKKDLSEQKAEQAKTAEEPAGTAGGWSTGEGLPSTKGPALIARAIAQAQTSGMSLSLCPVSTIISPSMFRSNMDLEINGSSTSVIQRIDAINCPISTQTWNEPPARLATSQGKGGDSPEGSTVRYSLRSREIIDAGCDMGGGLGTIGGISGRGKGRGRKSELTKAQLRASLDIAAGRQTSIEWALRAQKSPEVPT